MNGPRQQANATRAFTLIEVILATGVMALVIVVVHAAFFTALRLRDRTSDAVDRERPAQQAAAVLRRDLLCATAPNGPLSGAFRVGSIDEAGLREPAAIEFETATGALSPGTPWGEVQQVAYALVAPSGQGPGGGLDLVRRVTRNLLSTATPDVEDQWLMGGVQRLQVDCFDGAQWVNTWDTTAGNTNLPAAVRVRIEQAGPGAAAVELLVPVLSQAATNNV